MTPAEQQLLDKAKTQDGLSIADSAGPLESLVWHILSPDCEKNQSNADALIRLLWLLQAVATTATENSKHCIFDAARSYAYLHSHDISDASYAYARALEAAGSEVSQ
jgi:hypothetical protein